MSNAAGSLCACILAIARVFLDIFFIRPSKQFITDVRIFISKWTTFSNEVTTGLKNIETAGNHLAKGLGTVFTLWLVSSLLGFSKETQIVTQFIIFGYIITGCLVISLCVYICSKLKTNIKNLLVLTIYLIGSSLPIIIFGNELINIYFVGYIRNPDLAYNSYVSVIGIIMFVSYYACCKKICGIKISEFILAVLATVLILNFITLPFFMLLIDLLRK